MATHDDPRITREISVRGTGSDIQPLRLWDEADTPPTGQKKRSLSTDAPTAERVGPTEVGWGPPRTLKEPDTGVMGRQLVNPNPHLEGVSTAAGHTGGPDHSRAIRATLQ